MEEDREYTVLMENMEYALKEVRTFNFYSSLVQQIQEKSGTISDIFRDVSSSCVIPVVIYGLGRIQYSYAARFQLALALLLREVPGLEIDHEFIICCDNLTLNHVEERVMKTHGCKVVRMSGGRFRWRVDELTLFFLPFTKPEVLGDLPGMNWCSSQLEKIIILGRSLSSMAYDLEEMVSTNEQKRPEMNVKKLTYTTDKLRYLWAVSEYTWEFNISKESPPIHKSKGYNPEKLFKNMCWNGFDFDGIDRVEEDMNNFLPSTESCFKWVDDDTSYPYRMDEEDIEELPKLQHEMEITMIELRESNHYMKFRDQLHDNHLLKSEISSRLASMEQVQMIIYGLGSLEYDFASHYQLALALLLKKEIDILKIGEIQVFDPVITPADAALIRSLGCTVLSVNEYAFRKVEEPTLFFMPFAPNDLVSNLLETNWLPSRLENLIILGSSMHGWAEAYDAPDYGIFEKTEMEKLMQDDRYRYMITIKDWSVDFTVDRECIERPFNQFYWVFFNLPSEFDMSSILPSFTILDKIKVDHENAKANHFRELRNDMEDFFFKRFNFDYKWKTSFLSFDELRGLSRYRKTWAPPHANWIKLNFDGYGHDHRLCGYGGFLCNAKGEILLSYAGRMMSNGEDKISAQIEGLKQGVRCFKQLISNSGDGSNLIIEGSALSVIRWAKTLLPPPHKFINVFEEMSAMLGETNCVVQYIYEEANTKANELAKLGITLSEFSSW